MNTSEVSHLTHAFGFYPVQENIDTPLWDSEKHADTSNTNVGNSHFVRSDNYSNFIRLAHSTATTPHQNHIDGAPTHLSPMYENITNNSTSEPSNVGTNSHNPVAHVINNGKNKCKGRPGTLTEHDDLLIVREVAAQKGHLAKYGKVKEKWISITQNCNDSGRLSRKVSDKLVRDRFGRAFEEWKKRESQSLKSGEGGNLPTEIDELFEVIAVELKEAQEEKTETRMKPKQEKRLKN